MMGQHSGTIFVVLVAAILVSPVRATPPLEKGLKFKKEKDYANLTEYQKERRRGRRWIEVRPKALVIHGPDGNIEKEMPGDYDESSRPVAVRARPFNNHDKALIKRTRYTDDESFSASWDILSADGSSAPIGWEGAGEVYPAPDGSYLVGIGLVGYHNNGHVKIFSPDGKMLKDISVFDWGARQWRVVFSDDSKYCVLLQAGEKFIPSAGRPISADEFGAVGILSRDGNLLGKLERKDWKVVGPGDGLGNPHVRVLSSAKKVVLIQGDISSTLDVVEFSGKLSWSAPAKTSKKDICGINLASADTGDSIAILLSCSGKTKLKIFEGDSGKYAYSGDVPVYGTGPALPWKPVRRGERSEFRLLHVDDKFALVYSRAKKMKTGQVGHGLIIFQRDGSKAGEIDFKDPVEDIVVEDANSLVIDHGKRTTRWQMGK